MTALVTDLLSGLTDPGANAVGLGGYVHKDAVREALLNPTPAQMHDLRRVVYDALADASIPATMDREAFVVRAVLAAVAGRRPVEATVAVAVDEHQRKGHTP